MWLALASVLLLVQPKAAPRDVYFEQRTVTYSEGRAQDQGVLAKVWHSGSRIRFERADTPPGAALILNLAEGSGFRLDPASKIAWRVDMDLLRGEAQSDMSLAGSLIGAEAEQRVRLTELAERRAIAGHVCRGYRVRVESATWELWLAADVPVSMAQFVEYLEWSGASQAMGALLDEIARLPGFPMQTRVRATVQGRTIETVATIERLTLGPLAPHLFQPPPGFKIQQEEDVEK
jgi:hypothetical protein